MINQAKEKYWQTMMIMSMIMMTMLMMLMMIQMYINHTKLKRNIDKQNNDDVFKQNIMILIKANLL